MPTTVVGDTTIHYEVEGTGEPLLLVMGLGAQLTDWPQGFVDTLVAGGFQVIRHDNRDAGLSSEFGWRPPPRSAIARSLLTRRPIDAGYRLHDMAADAIGVLDAIGASDAHVVGASMGGMIAQEMAITWGHRVRSLTSIMSNTGDRRRGGVAPKVLWKLARAPAPRREYAVERSVEVARLICGPELDVDLARSMAEVSVARSFRPAGVDRQAAAIAASRDRTAALADVSSPTLVVHGLVDPLVRPSGGIATAKAIRGARLLMFPEMGHELPARRWDEIATAIRANAERDRSPAATTTTRV